MPEKYLTHFSQNTAQTWVDMCALESYKQGAGWSSPVARWAHNPKVVGSNPTPATNLLIRFFGSSHFMVGQNIKYFKYRHLGASVCSYGSSYIRKPSFVQALPRY